MHALTSLVRNACMRLYHVMQIGNLLGLLLHLLTQRDFPGQSSWWRRRDARDVSVQDPARSVHSSSVTSRRSPTCALPRVLQVGQTIPPCHALDISADRSLIHRTCTIENRFAGWQNVYGTALARMFDGGGIHLYAIRLLPSVDHNEKYIGRDYLDRDLFRVFHTPRGFFSFFRFFFFERTRLAASMRPPCLTYLPISMFSPCPSPFFHWGCNMPSTTIDTSDSTKKNVRIFVNRRKTSILKICF